MVAMIRVSSLSLRFVMGKGLKANALMINARLLMLFDAGRMMCPFRAPRGAEILIILSWSCMGG